MLPGKDHSFFFSKVGKNHSWSSAKTACLVWFYVSLTCLASLVQCLVASDNNWGSCSGSSRWEKQASGPYAKFGWHGLLRTIVKNHFKHRWMIWTTRRLFLKLFWLLTSTYARPLIHLLKISRIWIAEPMLRQFFFFTGNESYWCALQICWMTGLLRLLFNSVIRALDHAFQDKPKELGKYCIPRFFFCSV